MHVLDPVKITKIKQLLRHNPRGMTISDLSLRMNMNRNLMAKYLDILLFSGHVEMRVTGTAKVYFHSHRLPVSALLEFSSDYILVLDAESKIIQANARLMALLGLGREQLIGWRIGDIDHPFLNQISLHYLPQNPERTENKPVELAVILQDRKLHFSMKVVPMIFDDGNYGQTLLFEDISERKATEEKIRGYMLQHEFFSRKLQEFAELPPGADIYSAIGTGFSELIPDAIVDVNAYDPLSRTLRLKAIFGARAEEFVQRLGENKVRWNASPAYDSVPDVLGAGKLFHLPGGMQYASFNQLSAEAGEELEREFGIGDFYSIGLTWRGNLLGNILFILRRGGAIRNVPLVEIYARAASIALQRHIAEERLRAELNVHPAVSAK